MNCYRSLSILILIFLCNSLKSQIIRADINQWKIFESIFTEDYFLITSDTNISFKRIGFGANSLFFDLNAKTYHFEFEGKEYSTGKMSYCFEKGVYTFSCQTIDLNTNLPMVLLCTINTLASKPDDIYVSEYYADEVTRKSYGMISYYGEKK